MVTQKPYLRKNRVVNDMETIQDLQEQLRDSDGTVTLDMSDMFSDDYYGRTLRQTFEQGLSVDMINIDGTTAKYYDETGTMWYVETRTTRRFDDNESFDVVLHGDSRLVSIVLDELERELVEVKDHFESRIKSVERKEKARQA